LEENQNSVLLSCGGIVSADNDTVNACFVENINLLKKNKKFFNCGFENK